MVRWLPTLLALTSAVACLSAPAHAATYPGPEPGVIVADLNGDGRQDIAKGRGSLSVFLGHGDNPFAERVDSPTAASIRVEAVGDLNGDAAPDLVGIGPGAVAPLLNTGGGHFSSAPAISVSKASYSVAIADFNGDGRLDIALGSKARSVVVLPGNGDGSFGAEISTATPSSAPPPKVVQLGDFNGDGRPDLATAGPLLLGTGDGHFNIAANPLSRVRAETVGDLNGDGRSDLVGVNTADVEATVALATPDGGFAAPVTYVTGRGPVAVALADFTGDGHVDIITGDLLANRFSVLPGNGDGTFGAAVEYSDQPEHLNTFVAGDLDGDGRADLVMDAKGKDVLAVFWAARERATPVPKPRTAKRAAPTKQFARFGCETARRSGEELDRGPHGQELYNTVKGLFGCLRSRGPAVHLVAEIEDDYYVKIARFAGPYLAYTWEGVGAVEGGWYEIGLFDLRRGVRLYGPLDPMSVSVATLGRAGDAEGYVRDLVVKPNGSIAWTAEAIGDFGGNVLLLREVWALDSHGMRLLDHGEQIATRSLELKGSRLTWKKAGTTVSARLG